jgi:hypothetical protein
MKIIRRDNWIVTRLEKSMRARAGQVIANGVVRTVWAPAARRQRLILLCLVLNLPLQIVLKYIDVLSAGEQKTQFRPQDEFLGHWPAARNIRDGIVEPLKGRFDDASFWMQVAVTVACWRALRASVEVPGAPRDVPFPWRAGGTLCLVYVACEVLEPGTFFAVRPTTASTVVQFVEGTAYLFVILASLGAARDALAVATTIDTKSRDGLCSPRQRLVSAATAPLWGFSVYFFASQVITGVHVTNSEWMAAIAAVLTCASPYAVLLYRCMAAWHDRFDIRPELLNPFGITVTHRVGIIAARHNG